MAPPALAAALHLTAPLILVCVALARGRRRLDLVTAAILGLLVAGSGSGVLGGGLGGRFAARPAWARSGPALGGGGGGERHAGQPSRRQGDRGLELGHLERRLRPALPAQPVSCASLRPRRRRHRGDHGVLLRPGRPALMVVAAAAGADRGNVDRPQRGAGDRHARMVLPGLASGLRSSWPAAPRSWRRSCSRPGGTRRATTRHRPSRPVPHAAPSLAACRSSASPAATARRPGPSGFGARPADRPQRSLTGLRSPPPRAPGPAPALVSASSSVSRSSSTVSRSIAASSASERCGRLSRQRSTRFCSSVSLLSSQNTASDSNRRRGEPVCLGNDTTSPNAPTSRP